MSYQPSDLAVVRHGVSLVAANVAVTLIIASPPAGRAYRVHGFAVAPNVSGGKYAGWKAICRPATGSLSGRLDMGGATRTGYQLLVPGGVLYPVGVGIELIGSVDTVPDGLVFTLMTTIEAV